MKYLSALRPYIAINSVSGTPSSAYFTVGANNSAIDILPNFACNSYHESTVPGTEIGNIPNGGIVSRPNAANSDRI